MSFTTSVSVLVIVVVVATMGSAYATDYTVGDSSGWTNNMDYTTWLSNKTFNVGDSLLFSYSLLHSVDEVSKSDYDSCTSSNSVQTYTDGSTTIKLTAPGTRYFICGTAGHCSGGMKLAVPVSSSSSNSPSTTTPTGPTGGPSSPSGPTSGANAATTTTTTTGMVLGVMSSIVGVALMV